MSGTISGYNITVTFTEEFKVLPTGAQHVGTNQFKFTYVVIIQNGDTFTINEKTKDGLKPFTWQKEDIVSITDAQNQILWQKM